MLPRNRRNLPTLICAIIILSTARAGAAETLVMDNGDHLSGKLIQMVDNCIEFETDYAGTIKVNWRNVRQIVSDRTFQVLLGNGEVRETHALQRQENRITLDGAELTDDQIRKFNPAAWELGREALLAGEINGAFKLERGNTHVNSTDITGKLEWKKTRHRIRAAGEVEYGTSDGTLSSNRWSAETAYDTSNATQFYYGARTSLKSDKLADLNLRWTLGPHLGYRFIDTERSKLYVENGLEYTSENFGQHATNLYLADSWRIELSHFLIPGKLEAYHIARGLASLGSIGGVSYETWNGFKVPITGKLSTSAELKTSYTGDAPAEATKWDMIYQVKLGYQW